MIVKGCARGGAGNLAAHLEKDTNERVSVVEIDGLSATDIRGALREISALAIGTECQRELYHASISASPGEAELTPEQRARAVEVLAEELGLTGQPRIVVEHEKTGESGITRVHQHIVFSRVDDDGKTISDFQNYPKHERAARRIELELGHEKTQGVFDREDGTDRPTRTPSHADYQAGERSGLDPREAAATLTELWQQSDSGKAFVEAAAENGFTICRGDKCLLVVNEAGDHARLSRRLPNRAGDIAERLNDVTLPTLDEARTAQREAATPSEMAQEGIEPASPLILSPEAGGASPERPGAVSHDPIDVGLGPTPSTWDVKYDEVEAPEDSRPILAAELFREDAASYDRHDRSSDGDPFRDEGPAPSAGPSEPADAMDKGLSIVAGIAERTVGKAIEVVADAVDGLLGLFTGGGPEPLKPGGSSSPSQATAPEPPGQEQQREPEPQAKEVATSVPESFLATMDALRAKLGPEQLARIEQNAAERDRLRDFPRETRQRDFDDRER